MYLETVGKASAGKCYWDVRVENDANCEVRVGVAQTEAGLGDLSESNAAMMLNASDGRCWGVRKGGDVDTTMTCNDHQHVQVR